MVMPTVYQRRHDTEERKEISRQRSKKWAILLSEFVGERNGCSAREGCRVWFLAGDGRALFWVDALAFRPVLVCRKEKDLKIQETT